MVKKERKLAALRRRYAQARRHLAPTGWLLQGTITERTIRREDRERPGKHRDYGPYYQWTWKREGKTVTVNLTPRQAQAYREAIANHQALEKTLQQMRRLSRKILEATLPGVKKRRSTPRSAPA